MAWVNLRREDYVLGLTDGYVTERRERLAVPMRGTESQERIIAKRLYGLGKRLDAQDTLAGEGQYEQVQRLQIPDPLHVWVIGDQGWLARPLAEPIHSICESETDPSYRMVIVGVGLGRIRQPYLANWGAWVYAAGMRRKRRHVSLAGFRSAGTTLLKKMHDYYGWRGEPPSAVLHALELPVECYSDWRNSRDIPS